MIFFIHNFFFGWGHMANTQTHTCIIIINGQAYITQATFILTKKKPKKCYENKLQDYDYCY